MSTYQVYHDDCSHMGEGVNVGELRMHTLIKGINILLLLLLLLLIGNGAGLARACKQ